MSTETQPAPQPTTELLQRILEAVAPPKRKRGVEIACAVILSLATTASAWCAYQAKLWGGAQMARANAAARASREQAVNTLAALQGRAFDASMFIMLFFGGIARAWDSRALRNVLALLAVGLFLATLAGLLTMPICHE